MTTQKTTNSPTKTLLNNAELDTIEATKIKEEFIRYRMDFRAKGMPMRFTKLDNGRRFEVLDIEGNSLLTYELVYDEYINLYLTEK